MHCCGIINHVYRTPTLIHTQCCSSQAASVSMNTEDTTIFYMDEDCLAHVLSTLAGFCGPHCGLGVSRASATFTLKKKKHN